MRAAMPEVATPPVRTRRRWTSASLRALRTATCPRLAAPDRDVAAAGDRVADARRGARRPRGRRPSPWRCRRGRAARPGARTTRPSASTLSPARLPAGRARRPPRRRGGERRVDVGAAARVPRVLVAVALELAEQGGVDEPAAALGRPARRRDRAPQQRRGGHGGAGVVVERVQLAAGAEARERGLDRLDARVDAVGEPVERGAVERGGLQPHHRLAAHRGEREIDAGHGGRVG